MRPVQAQVRIVNWAIPEHPAEYELKVTVDFHPWGSRADFYLVHTPPQEGTSTRRPVAESWEWYQWSIADKPSVKVRNEEIQRSLNHLVQSHDILGLLAGYFGIEQT